MGNPIGWPGGCFRRVEALTTQGRIVRIRAVAAGDMKALRALNRPTSDASLYLRFFALNRRAAADYVTRLVRPEAADIARSSRSSLLSRHAKLLASRLWGLWPDAVSTGEEAGVQVVKHCEHGIVCRVTVLDDAGTDVELVTRFLSHLSDAGTARTRSVPTPTIYGTWRRLSTSRPSGGTSSGPGRRWNPGVLRRVPSRRPAQRLGLTAATEGGRLLSAATVQRVLAATSSFSP